MLEPEQLSRELVGAFVEAGIRSDVIDGCKAALKGLSLPDGARPELLNWRFEGHHSLVASATGPQTVNGLPGRFLANIGDKFTRGIFDYDWNILLPNVCLVFQRPWSADSLDTSIRDHAVAAPDRAVTDEFIKGFAAGLGVEIFLTQSTDIICGPHYHRTVALTARAFEQIPAAAMREIHAAVNDRFNFSVSVLDRHTLHVTDHSGLATQFEDFASSAGTLVDDFDSFRALRNHKNVYLDHQDLPVGMVDNRNAKICEDAILGIELPDGTTLITVYIPVRTPFKRSAQGFQEFGCNPAIAVQFCVPMLTGAVTNTFCPALVSPRKVHSISNRDDPVRKSLEVARRAAGMMLGKRPEDVSDLSIVQTMVTKAYQLCGSILGSKGIAYIGHSTEIGDGPRRYQITSERDCSAPFKPLGNSAANNLQLANWLWAGRMNALSDQQLVAALESGKLPMKGMILPSN